MTDITPEELDALEGLLANVTLSSLAADAGYVWGIVPRLIAAARKEQKMREALTKLHESKAMNAWGHSIAREALK